MQLFATDILHVVFFVWEIRIIISAFHYVHLSQPFVNFYLTYRIVSRVTNSRFSVLIKKNLNFPRYFHVHTSYHSQNPQYDKNYHFFFLLTIVVYYENTRLHTKENLWKKTSNNNNGRQNKKEKNGVSIRWTPLIRDLAKFIAHSNVYFRKNIFANIEYISMAHRIDGIPYNYFSITM